MGGGGDEPGDSTSGRRIQARQAISAGAAARGASRRRAVPRRRHPTRRRRVSPAPPPPPPRPELDLAVASPAVGVGHARAAAAAAPKALPRRRGVVTETVGGLYGGRARRDRETHQARGCESAHRSGRAKRRIRSRVKRCGAPPRRRGAPPCWRRRRPRVCRSTGSAAVVGGQERRPRRRRRGRRLVRTVHGRARARMDIAQRISRARQRRPSAAAAGSASAPHGRPRERRAPSAASRRRPRRARTPTTAWLDRRRRVFHGLSLRSGRGERPPNDRTTTAGDDRELCTITPRIQRRRFLAKAKAAFISSSAPHTRGHGG